MVGAGQANDSFLSSLSKLLGEHYVTEYSVSAGKNGSSNRSTSQVLRPIMTVDDLHSLRTFEAVILLSGDDPFMGKLLPWFDRKDMKEKVQASKDAHEPKGLVTV